MNHAQAPPLPPFVLQNGPPVGAPLLRLRPDSACSATPRSPRRWLALRPIRAYLRAYLARRPIGAHLQPRSTNGARSIAPHRHPRKDKSGVPGIRPSVLTTSCQPHLLLPRSKSRGKEGIPACTAATNPPTFASPPDDTAPGAGVSARSLGTTMPSACGTSSTFRSGLSVPYGRLRNGPPRNRSPTSRLRPAATPCRHHAYRLRRPRHPPQATRPRQGPRSPRRPQQGLRSPRRPQQRSPPLRLVLPKSTRRHKHLRAPPETSRPSIPWPP